jgi:hypothetical protein
MAIARYKLGIKYLLTNTSIEVLRPMHEELLKLVEESRAEVAALVATATEMRDTIQRHRAQNRGLRNESQTACKKLSESTRVAITPPPPPATPSPPPHQNHPSEDIGVLLLCLLNDGLPDYIMCGRSEPITPHASLTGCLPNIHFQKRLATPCWWHAPPASKPFPSPCAI